MNNEHASTNFAPQGDNIGSTTANELDLDLNLDYELSVNDVKSKIVEFSQFLSSTGKLTLLKCNKTECEEFIYLLLTLRKDIKHTLTELGQLQKKTRRYYQCGECNETIEVDPKHNFWTSLQTHEHFEEMYCKFVNGTLHPMPADTQMIPSISNSAEDTVATVNTPEVLSENAHVHVHVHENDSGIDNENGEIESNEIGNTSEVETPYSEDEGVNSFRFNFRLRYDDLIESKLYPQGLMKSVQKVDRSSEYTIQRAGLARAVCLLCSCDMVTKSRISKINLMDHALGQRHLRFASNATNMEALKQYHETWLNLELSYQAHQVYFKPDISSTFKCVICNLFIKCRNIAEHIRTDPHKRNVLEMFEKKNFNFFLTELQVQVYGITLEQIEANARDTKKKKETARVKKKNEKTDSDSSPSESREPVHHIIKSVENPSSKNVLELLPNRFKEHLTFFKERDNQIGCSVCQLTLPKNIGAIKKHIKQAAHVIASKIVPKKYSFYCEICNIKIYDEGSWEKHFAEKPVKHSNMAESRKNKTIEYECTKCCTVIYGDDLSLTRHLSVGLGREKKTKEVKLPELVKKLFKSNEIITNEGYQFTLEADGELKYNQLTKECCARLGATLSPVFEDCKVYPFGSRISGLGNKHSDLDVFIDIGEMYTGYKNQDPVSQVQLVRKAGNCFSKHKDEFQDVVQIPTARTPIVKLYHKITDIECDLSFRHGLSVENTKFLRFCFDLLPITQPFILLLKKWSEYNGLTEHITTYALAILAIFYLQANNYLLSVKKLRELNPEKSLVINGWETIKYTMPLEHMKTFVEPCPYTVVKLLKDFFAYYAKFSYPNDVICPLLGHVIKKKQFFEDPLGKKLPEEMKSYIAQLQSEEPEQFRAMSPFCIQDPFDLSHNLTKACQTGTLNKFKILCDLSFQHLESL